VDDVRVGQAGERGRLTDEQFAGSRFALQLRVQQLHCDGVGGRPGEPAGGIVVEPASVNDAHSPFADDVPEHRATPVFEAELGAGPDAEFPFDDRHPAMRAKARLVDDDAPALGTVLHSSVSITEIAARKRWSRNVCAQARQRGEMEPRNAERPDAERDAAIRVAERGVPVGV